MTTRVLLLRESMVNWMRVTVSVAVVVIFVALGVLETWLARTPLPSIDDSPWISHISAMHDALARHDPSGAVHQWQQAYLAALGSRRWDAMVAVGDASVVMAKESNGQARFVGKAREAYLTALFRSRHEQSLEGVLRVTKAFTDLGDDQVVQQCLRIAHQLAAGKAGVKLGEREIGALVESKRAEREEP